MSRHGHDEHRLFVRGGFRHHRRTYSLAEVRWGFAALAVCAAVAAWVFWRGRHPDPALFASVTLAGDSRPDSIAPADRGPVPAALATDGWSEGPLGRFDPDDLYVKIDGRADYFLALGFVRLYTVTVTGKNAEQSGEPRSVDVEIYDLGAAANAIGAYAGEQGEDADSTVTDQGLWRVAQNALFMTRGRYYVRAIGADDSTQVVTELHRLKDVLTTQVPGEPLPWAYELFTGQMGLVPDRVDFAGENAFSFGFARDVWSAGLADEKTEVFVVANGAGQDAHALAEQFVDGFAGYGEAEGPRAGVRWVKDRYLGSYATAVVADQSVLGVRAAPSLQAGQAALAELSAAWARLPASVRAAAGASVRAPDTTTTPGTKSVRGGASGDSDGDALEHEPGEPGDE